ncbi:MAG: hypothetical protein HY080_15845 [Gammaproteobacteria bacterium]|nr:hypothetical protein [Gammaproteobacteria bacterium]
MRVKSKWNVKDKTHSIEEVAGALAYIAWRIAQNAVLNLENNDFQTDTNQQRLSIMAEFLCFTLHIIDRMTIERFDADERVRFMTEMANKSAKNIHDNTKEMLGEGEYRKPFIELLNNRMAEYAEFQYDEKEGPSFPMRRYFGNFVTAQMGEKNQRWVGDQIIDVEAPDIVATLTRSVPNLFM